MYCIKLYCLWTFFDKKALEVGIPRRDAGAKHTVPDLPCDRAVPSGPKIRQSNLRHIDGSRPCGMDLTRRVPLIPHLDYNFIGILN